MSKLSRIFQSSSRSQMFQKRLFGEDMKESFLFPHCAWMSTARTNFTADGKLSDRVFADYTIFKGKGALSVHPRLPTFSKLDSGDLKIDRRGSIMLTFRPAIGERKYDSEKKQLFALSATEVGSFISLSPGESCEFFHDPSMLSSNAGQVRKSLSIKPLGDRSGYFISLTVVNTILNTNERVTVPVTTAEFAVMREAFSFALPHILGWAAGCTNQISSSKQESHPKLFPQRMDSEWDR